MCSLSFPQEARLGTLFQSPGDAGVFCPVSLQSGSLKVPRHQEDEEELGVRGCVPTVGRLQEARPREEGRKPYELGLPHLKAYNLAPIT